MVQSRQLLVLVFPESVHLQTHQGLQRLTATYLPPSLSPADLGRSIDAPVFTCLSNQRQERDLPEGEHRFVGVSPTPIARCPCPWVSMQSICQGCPTTTILQSSQHSNIDMLACSCRLATSLRCPGPKLTSAAQKAMKTFHHQLGLSAPPLRPQARSRPSGHVQNPVLLLPLTRFQIQPEPERTWSFCCCVRSKARSHSITRPSIPLCHMSIGSILFAPSTV